MTRRTTWLWFLSTKRSIGSVPSRHAAKQAWQLLLYPNLTGSMASRSELLCMCQRWWCGSGHGLCSLLSFGVRSEQQIPSTLFTLQSAEANVLHSAGVLGPCLAAAVPTMRGIANLSCSSSNLTQAVPLVVLQKEVYKYRDCLSSTAGHDPFQAQWHSLRIP